MECITQNHESQNTSLTNLLIFLTQRDYQLDQMAFLLVPQASQANKSVKKSGTGGGSPTLAMTPPSATSSKPPPTPALGDHEVMELVRDTLDQVYALCLETLQEMDFIWEVDRALAKSIMSEFIRLQLIVGDDLNTSLWGMHADLEATTDELIRDLDIAAQNSTDSHLRILQ